MILTWILLLWTSFFASFKQEEGPAFKGGRKDMAKFISENLIYPGFSKQNCIQGTIEVSFKLTREGKVFGSKVQKGMGIDLDEEALRIVRLTSGKWNMPASFDTTTVLVMPVSFSLSDSNCATRSPAEIRDAINAYRAQEELTGAITNFYAKREQNNFSAEDEQKILRLKEQLGYDDEFIDDLIEQARKKLKQGDKDGACEDLQFIRKIGSNKADRLIEASCK
ncbi:energy transducer TonB family protein [Arcticibacter tournemirensis]